MREKCHELVTKIYSKKEYSFHEIVKKKLMLVLLLYFNLQQVWPQCINAQDIKGIQST